MSYETARGRKRRELRGARGRRLKIVAVTGAGSVVILVVFGVALAASEGQSGPSAALLGLLAGSLAAVFLAVYRVARAPGRSRLSTSAVAATATVSSIAIPALAILVVIELSSS